MRQNQTFRVASNYIYFGLIVIFCVVVVNLNAYFDIFVMQSVSDSSPVNIGGLNAPLSNPYVFTLTTNITGMVVKIAKNGNDENTMLALCTVSVYSDNNGM